MKKIFKDRYVLGTGYPWAMGINPHTEVALCTDQKGTNFKPIKFPIALWYPDLPKYRLVLERVA